MKPAKVLVYVSLAIIALASGTVLFWLYGPSDVLRINNSPFPIKPSVQKSDNLVFMSVSYCKLLPAHGVVRRFLVSDTVRIALPLQQDNGPVTCTQAEVPLLIPKTAVPDKYHVHIDVVYHLNPVRQVTETLDSQDFLVE